MPVSQYLNVGPRTYSLNDFSGGIQSANANPLAWPKNAISDGRDFIVKNKALNTRKGYKVIHDFGTSLPVWALRQVLFPTPDQAYMLVVYEDDGTNHSMLAVSTTALPSESLSFTDIYDLGGSGRIPEIDTLNDRAVLVEPNNVPLAFSGCMSSNGSDWAVPKQVMFADGSVAPMFSDISQEMCDADPNTKFTIGTRGTYFSINVCCDVEKIEGIYIELATGNTVTSDIVIKRRSGGAWVQINDWTDNTDVDGKTLAQSGTITGTGYTSEVYVQAQVPGHWFQITFSVALSTSTSISRILVKQPCQPLSNLGDGQPDICSTILYYVASKTTYNDFTVSLSDYQDTTQALNDGDLESPTGMTSSDFIYVCHPKKFNKIILELYPNCNNTNVSTLSAYYYSAGAWHQLTITDNTSMSSKTFNRSGSIEWDIPSDWERYSFGIWPMGYWVYLKVSATLQATVELNELHILPVEDPVKRHDHVFRFRDRLVMLGRTDQKAQVDISRKLEEFGWCSEDAWSDVMAGSDAIIAAVEAYNQGWIFRSRDLYILNGFDPATFSLERAEIAGRCPVNKEVLVKAPVIESDDKAKMGFYFLAHEGMFHFTGLQLYDLSISVPWFWNNTAPCLDHENLYKARGVYLPEHQWIVWAVPMKFGVSAQTTNNALIVYDLNFKIWYPPMMIAAVSLCVAKDYVSSAPGKSGRERLYIGTYDGKILEVFGETDDESVEIEPYIETGWLSFDLPGMQKRINQITVYGDTGNTPIELSFYIDGNESECETIECSDNLPPNVLFTADLEKANIPCYLVKLKIEAFGPTWIYDIDFEYSLPPER